MGRSFPYAAYKQMRPNDEPAFGVEEIYYQMYLLAIGIQMAGPEPHPADLRGRACSPTPAASGPRGMWGFGAGDYTPTDDFREIWWDPNRISGAEQQAGRVGAAQRRRALRRRASRRPARRLLQGGLTVADLDARRVHQRVHAARRRPRGAPRRRCARSRRTSTCFRGYGPLVVGADPRSSSWSLLAPSVAPERVVEQPVNDDHHHRRSRPRRDRARARTAPRVTRPPRSCSASSSRTRSSTGCRLSPLPEVMPWGVITQGVIFGTSYALLAMGLILIYRTTRIVNFAYGAMGAMPGTLTVGLFMAQGLELLARHRASASSSAPVAGAARRHPRDPPLRPLVAPRRSPSPPSAWPRCSAPSASIIGVAPRHRRASSATSRRRSAASFFVRPYPVRGDHLLMLGAGAGRPRRRSAGSCCGTDAGRAVRAAAENQDRALLLGVPVRRLQTIVWAVAGALSTVTFITKAPFTGVVPDGARRRHARSSPAWPSRSSPGSSRCRSRSGAGIGLGIAEWTIRWNVDGRVDLRRHLPRRDPRRPARCAR